MTMIWACFCLTLSSASEPALDMSAVARQIQRAYTALDTLRFDVRIEEECPPIGFIQPAIDRTIDVKVSMATGRRFHIVAHVDDQPFAILVSDGQEVVEWAGKHRQWTRYPMPAPQSPESHACRRLLVKSAPLAGYTLGILDSGLPVVDWLKKEPAAEISIDQFDGRSCMVIRLDEQDSHPMNPNMLYKRSDSLYFDPATHFLVHQAVISKGISKAGSETKTLTGTSRKWYYENIEPNAELPDGIFAFTPPEGSTFIAPDDDRFKRYEEPPSLDGKPAPEFSLRSVQGDDVALSDFRNKKAVLLVFWATWCGPCKLEMPLLVKLHEEFGNDQLAVVAVSTDREMSTVQAFLKANPLPYAILHDADRKAGMAYHVGGVPHTVLIDKSRRIVKTWTGWGGAHEEKEIRAELAKLGIAQSLQR